MKVKDFMLFGLLLCSLFGIFSGQCSRDRKIIVEHRTDTLYIRDTITIIEPRPYIERIRDTITVTVFVPVEVEGSSDFIPVPVELPIEEKEYRGPDYYALVRGYRPELVRLDLFPETKTIFNSEIQHIRTRPRFGVGVQVGYGYNGKKITPYVGLGLQYNLLTF